MQRFGVQASNEELYANAVKRYVFDFFKAFATISSYVSNYSMCNILLTLTCGVILFIFLTCNVDTSHCLSLYSYSPATRKKLLWAHRIFTEWKIVRNA